MAKQDVATKKSMANEYRSLFASGAAQLLITGKITLQIISLTRLKQSYPQD